MKPAVIVFLKAPRAGEVKTRLARELGVDQAVRIYRSLAEDQVQRIPPTWRTEVLFTPENAEAEMRNWLGDRIFYRPQSEGDLGARLAAGFAAVFAEGCSPVIAIGGDCPDLDEACLDRARAALREHDVVLGPATDGGYYLIGLNRPASGLFSEIPWSTGRVLEETQQRVSTAGLRCHLLEPKTDIDDAESWTRHLQSHRSRESDALTVIIPALNEAANIQGTVRSVRSALPDAHVIMVDGGSSDATVALATSEGAEVIFAARGRGVQLAAGAACARTPWLLFLHADTKLPAAASDVLAEFCRKPDAHIATFRLQFDRGGWFLRACCWFTRFDSVLTRFGDQGILVRADFYRMLGGFPAWPLFEDVALLQRARRHTRIWSLPATVTTSARRFEHRGHLSQQQLNARLLFRYLLGTPPERLAEIYRASAQSKRTPAVTAAPLLDDAERSKR